MAPAPIVSRPVPRAGAILLLLAGITCLALGGFLTGTAIFGSEAQLVFLHDARMQHATGIIDDASARAREIEAIQRRGGTERNVARAIDEANRYFDALREARDNLLRVNAKRWRRMQGFLGGWLCTAGLALLITGTRQWRQAATAP